MADPFTKFFSHAAAAIIRTSALSTLNWSMVILLVGLISLVVCGAPNWLLVVVVVMISLIIIVYIWAYIYFMFNDKDALRSERHNLQKMAIERGYVGDHLHGLIDVHSGSQKMLPSENTDEEGQS